MKVPLTGKEISKKWVEYILKEHRAATRPPALLRVDACTVREDLGDGYNAQVVFFTVETTEKDESSSPEVKKEYHLVAKLLSQLIMSRVFNQKMKATFREYLVYTDIINEMNKMLNEKAPDEKKISLPKLIYGKCTSKEFVLVMEDLQYSGYEMSDKQKGMNGEQLKAAVDQIARVHALSYVYRQSADLTKYSCFPSVKDHINTFNVMMKPLLEMCAKFLESSEETQELGSKLTSCIPALLEQSTTAVCNTYTINCLLHGDYWNNNFMFKYADDSDGQKIIEEVKIIDWGNSSWGSPIFDLQYLLYTSTTRSIRKDYQDEVLSLYHQTFMKITTQLGSPPANWSLEQLRIEWKNAYVTGFLLGCTLTQGTLSTTNPAKRKPKPSVLDKPLLLPVKSVVEGMQMSLGKAMANFSLSSAGKKLMQAFAKKMFTPVFEELMSGKNEVMNTRLLELIYEADENGLFIT